MLKKAFMAIAAILGTLGFSSSNTFAVSGDTATIAGGKTWSICVSTGSEYTGSQFAADISGEGFESQVVFGDFTNTGCKSVKLGAGNYSVRLRKPMGVNEVSYDLDADTLTYIISNVTNKYFSSFGSVEQHIDGSGEPTTFPKVFGISGSCTFHNTSNITGETCVDENGKSYTDYKYIDTGVKLFSRENASKDFEVYFEIENYESTQESQATYFNAKLEDSSKYYPGFAVRIKNTAANRFEITSRKGVNSSSDKKTFEYGVVANETIKIIRKNGVITYSLNGEEFQVLDDFSDFSAFFDQTALFGASQTSSGSPMRIFRGTLKNMYIKLGKIETPPKQGVAILDSGVLVNAKMKKMSGTLSSLSSNYGEDENIKAILEAEELPSGFDTSDTDHIISSSESDHDIYAWYDNTNNDGIIYLYTDAATIKGGEEMNEMFSDLQSLTDISAVSDWDTSETQEMSELFYENYSLEDISPLANWNTSNVGDMWGMFWGAKSIRSVDALETKQHDGKDYVSWNMSNVYTISSMFGGAESLTDISALASWDTSEMYSMHDLFSGASSLTDISPLANWDLTEADDMGCMFYNASSLTDISPLANWDISSSTTDIDRMFSGASSLTDISPLANWNTSYVEDMEYMFENTAITNVDALETKQHEGKDYVSWDMSNVMNASGMFSGAANLTDISALASWDISKIERMDYLFSGTAITNVDALETKQHEGKDYVSWDMSNVRYINDLFQFADSLVDISALASWNTSNIEEMESVFDGTAIVSADALETKQYDGKDYTSWDVSNVRKMYSLFGSASNLTDISALASWNVSNVTDMNSMFYGVSSLTNISALAGWNVSNVANMNNMFDGASGLTDISALAGWSVSSVESMYRMFADVTGVMDFKTPLEDWPLNSFVNTRNMFESTSPSAILPSWYN